MCKTVTNGIMSFQFLEGKVSASIPLPKRRKGTQSEIYDKPSERLPTTSRPYSSASSISSMNYVSFMSFQKLIFLQEI